ncbi:unnamed protein product [Brassicogethes aeneus]|uniref:Uncharacterized protein n=1 Tax=Brassicogethes aeneus TaxID=1431903 RepID=A0A9P0ASM1_BRAAE|nr:unnamed protein product [Brassicogethes aeneus]
MRSANPAYEQGPRSLTRSFIPGDGSLTQVAPATKKIHLEAIPVSKETKFDEGDISEMLFVLQHSNLQTCQPTKVKQMFASRACRKSVMIGTPLLPSVMKKIVDHMGDIHQPWLHFFRLFLSGFICKRLVLSDFTRKRLPSPISPANICFYPRTSAFIRNRLILSGFTRKHLLLSANA